MLNCSCMEEVKDMNAFESVLEGFFTESQRARLYAAVPQRMSVRSFEAPPDVAQLSALSFSAQRLTLSGVRIELGEADEKKLYRHFPFTDTITGSGRYAAIIVNKKAPNAMLHAGISGEALALEAVSLGLGTCWVAGSYRKSAVNIALNADEKLVAIIALGVPKKMKHGRVKHKKLTDICVGDPVVWPMWAYNAAECVRVAPSAMNRQPWRLIFAGRTLMLEKKGFASRLDMGIALLHLSLGVEKRPHIIRLGSGRQIATLNSEDRT